MIYHKPVLLEEAIEALKIRDKGIYVDATFGGGGHADEIINKLTLPGKLIAIDQDEEALQQGSESGILVLVKGNFRFLKRYIKYLGVDRVDGILADLGVSSHQFDKTSRGFSYRGDAMLDMRMNQSMLLTAADILNSYKEAELIRMFSHNGELRNSKTLAKILVDHRKSKPLKNVEDLISVVRPVIRGSKFKYLSQMFQAIRMEVNDELGALESFLKDSEDVLSVGGRLVIISYHSVEDRMVKNYFKFGNVSGERFTDEYGNPFRPFKIISKGVITPNQSEISDNSRARSARMRVAEKV